ncbi:MAG: prepilin-type N-terminal cleavage/methylation domain-containing protein [Gemmatimonadetes bacterium]|nr:prepilin-type N-terminal cleavage/methylation domain-containing protein [Gemmatimonadota bacterium]
MTLVELLVALVLLGIVSAGIYRVLVNNQRIYQAQTQRIDLQQNVRAAVSILPGELRELDAYDGDIIAMSASSITIRAMRQLAILCNTPALGVANPQLIIRNQPFFAMRNFNTATDSIFVYYEGDQATRNDDGWIPGRITAIAPAVCPTADAAPGQLLTTNLGFGAGQINQTGRIQIGSPVRGWERVTYRLYQAPDGQYYIGQEIAGVTQPLVGPVLANGFELAYRDSTGAITAAPTLVASIDVQVRGQTAQPVRQTDGSLGRPVDSVTTRVALRNNRRF